MRLLVTCRPESARAGVSLQQRQTQTTTRKSGRGTHVAADGVAEAGRAVGVELSSLVAVLDVDLEEGGWNSDMSETNPRLPAPRRAKGRRTFVRSPKPVIWT